MLNVSLPWRGTQFSHTNQMYVSIVPMSNEIKRVNEVQIEQSALSRLRNIFKMSETQRHKCFCNCRHAHKSVDIKKYHVICGLSQKRDA